MKIEELLKKAVDEQVSDVFIVAGRPVSFRKNGLIHKIDDDRLLPQHTDALLHEIYTLAENRDFTRLAAEEMMTFLLPCPVFPVSVSVPTNSAAATLL